MGLQFHSIKNLDVFFMESHNMKLNLNSKHVDKIHGKAVINEYAEVFQYKQDKHTGKDMKPNDNEFKIYVDTMLAGRLKDVKVRPSTKIAKLKEQVIRKLKEQKGITLKSEDFYLKAVRCGVLVESRTVLSHQLRLFEDLLLVRTDGEK